MFLTKNAKIKCIKQYLSEKQTQSVFDKLLEDFVNCQLEEKLSNMGLQKIDIHIDWLDDYKCIAIQARRAKFYVEIQIYPSEFTIAYDEDEADDDMEFELLSVNAFYETVKNILKSIC